jgi:hypothetical protein
MTKPKVLILVSGGVANYLCIGDVEVQIVDEDNIDSGNPPVKLNPEWEPYIKGVFDLPHSKYVYIAGQPSNL